MIDKLKQLREQTCASMVECRKALEESGGDLAEAAKIIRRKGSDLAGKKAGRETKQGLIEAYIHVNGKIGVLLELSCETDFVVRNEMFKELAHDLAMHIAAMNPQYTSSIDIPQEIIEEEKKIYQEQLESSGKPQNIVDQIIEGKIRKHNEEICLLSQPFVKNQDLSVQDYINEAIAKIGENIKVGRFVRFEI